MYDSTPPGDRTGKFFKPTDLNAYVEPFEDDVREALAETAASSKPDSAFVDVEFEFMHPNTFTYTDGISSILLHGRQEQAARLAAYRGFHFAVQVSGLVLPENPAIAFGDFFDRNTDNEELRRKLETSASEYLGRCAALDRMTAYFMPEIDPTGRYGHVAEIVAGSTFMFVDNAERDRVINDSVARFSGEIESFLLED